MKNISIRNKMILGAVIPMIVVSLFTFLPLIRGNTPDEIAQVEALQRPLQAFIAHANEIIELQKSSASIRQIDEYTGVKSGDW